MRDKSTFAGVLFGVLLMVLCGTARAADFKWTKWATVRDSQQNQLKISFGRPGTSKIVYARVLNGYSFNVSGVISFDLVNVDSGAALADQVVRFKDAKGKQIYQKMDDWFSLPGEKETVKKYAVRKIRIQELWVPLASNPTGRKYKVYPTGAPKKQPKKNVNSNQQKLEKSADSQLDSDALFKLGLKAFKKEDYVTTMKWYRKAADKGNDRAMFNIAYLYQNGQGVTKDYSLARQWFRKAAEEGNAGAMVNIGVFYAHGQGVSQDYKKAMQWFRKAAAKGNTNAVANIGSFYVYGRGVPQDYKEAMQWFRKAAAKGNTNAMANIALLYRRGHGVTKNTKTAIKWYQKAAQKGDRGAMYSLGFIHFNGSGIPRNKSVAISWFKKAAKAGHPKAIKVMKQLEKKG